MSRGRDIMVKRFRWPLLALAVALVGYFAASRLDPTPDQPPELASSGDAAPQIASTRPQHVLRGGEIPFGPGRRPYFRVLDPNTGRVRYEFRTVKWEPTSDSVFQMERPEIRIHMPGGQMSVITADTGELELSAAARTNLNPRRGWLRGNVKVVIDRTGRRWRAANPERAAMEAHPEHLIHIWLEDEARFDLEASRLVTSGAVRMQSEEVDIAANGGPASLEVRWDQIDNRLEHLAFQYGGRMELLRGGGLVEFAMPGSERSTQNRKPEPSKASIATKSDGSKSAPADPDQPDVAGLVDRALISGAPLEEILKLQRDRPKRIETYQAVFQGDVGVRQTRGLRPLGSLDCDELKLVFEVGEDRRRAGRVEPATQPADRGPAADAPRQEPPVDVAFDDRTRLVVTWTGPMTLTPLAVEPSTQTGKRFDAVATGQRVRVHDRQGTAVCARMEYRNEDAAVTFVGGAAGPAELLAEDGRRMVAPTIMIDRSAGRAALTGAGLMFDPGTRTGGAMLPAALRDPSGRSTTERRTDQPVEIRWTQDVQIELAQHEWTSVDPDTGQRRTRTADYLHKARFRGDVTMSQGRRELSGQEVAMTFGAPRRRRSLADHITRLDVRGDVRMREGDQIITAAALDVEMTLTPDGRNVPTRAVGSGNVRVTEPDRFFRADEVDVRFGMRRRRQEPDGSTASRIGLRRILAEGRVSARDQRESLEIDAATLDAQFDVRGELVHAEVEGPGEETWAHTQRGDYVVNAHHIDVDTKRQKLTAQGRGHAAFITRSDFDGRRLDETTSVNITFTDGMTMDGIDNFGVFNGVVTASTRTNLITCNEQLTVRFADAGRDAEAKPESSSPPPGRFLGKQLGAFPRWLAGRFDPPSRRSQRKSGSIRKRPVYVYAKGDAVAVSTDYGAAGNLEGRMRLAGPAFDVDLRRERLNVPGRGTLLIEDYRPARSARDAGRNTGRTGAAVDMSAGVPLPGATSRSGPSQTLFVFGNAMSFNMADGLVNFDRNVQMVHRSGAELLKDESAALFADVDALRLGHGRRATLNCDTLDAQFATRPSTAAAQSVEGRASPASRIRWNEARRMVAQGHVHLEEGARSLDGDRIYLDGESNFLVLQALPGSIASLTEQDERTQAYRTWRGPEIRWNRETGEIWARRPRITSR
ncbi:MAG: hypothetical protein V3T70_03995 [Phycisphaerae bacterium]